MRILFLSQRVPYPPNRGDKITTWRLVERMSRRHSVKVVAFAHEPADREAAEVLTKRGIPTRVFPVHSKLSSLPLLLTRKPLTLGVYGSRPLQAAVDELAKESDLAYAYSSSMGAFFLRHPQLPRVMHFAELDSDKWRQYAERSAPPARWIYSREWRTLLAFERELAHQVSENIFCTPLEQRIFQEQIPGASSIVLRNGVDLDYYRPSTESAEPGHLVFTGVMDYLPNTDGCIFFVEEVMPLLRKRFPDVRFTIVGARPTPQVQRLAAHPGITVTGFVPDTREYLRRATISVAPLRIARGIQNKVLEALAMGLPVVGTRSATQGIEGEAGVHFALAETAQEHADRIGELLANPEQARALGSRGRRFVEDHYNWEHVLAPLNELLDQLHHPGGRPLETSIP